MALPRLGQRRFIWAPRTLAVISCALALLVAQPASYGAGAGVKARAVVLGVGGGGVGGRVEVSKVVARESGRGAAVREEATFFSSARRLHILATVEILQRLLMSELRGVERQALPTMWWGGECVGLVVVPATTGVVGLETVPERVVGVERDFAMGHCLLAPPVV